MVHKKIDVRKIFQDRLLAALRDLGVPQHGQGKWLADKTKHTPKGVGKWLNGESMPQPEKWADLAVDLGKAPSYFYANLGEPEEGEQQAPRNATEHIENFVVILKTMPPAQILKTIAELTEIAQEALSKSSRD